MKNVFAVLIGLVMLTLSGQAEAARIHNPTWNGYALDWCRNFETGCGKPAADLFCQKRGSPQATGWMQRPGVSFPTMTIGQNAVCNPAHHRCDSFAYIDCQETTKVFYAPKYNGYRLDWCRQFETGCGAPAAQLFCQKNGYSQVLNFQIQTQMTVPTMTVATNAVCDPRFHRCDSFTYVQCKK